MTMDIMSAFDTVSASEDGSWLHLTIPTTGGLAYADDKETKPLRIKLKGPNSPEWRNFHRKTMKQNDKPQNKHAPEKTLKEQDLEDSKLLAAMTIDWENIPQKGGKTFWEFSRDNAITVYMGHKGIRDQCIMFSVNVENFTGTQLEA